MVQLVLLHPKRHHLLPHWLSWKRGHLMGVVAAAAALACSGCLGKEAIKRMYAGVKLGGSHRI